MATAPGGQFNSQIPLFLTSFLGQFPTAIPKGAQWALFFNNLDDVVDVILQTLEEREPAGWDIDALANKIAKSEILQTNKGCLFAQAVEIPGENIVANPEGLQMNGFLRTTVGGGRGDYANGIKIAFLETNFSFVDTVIRPWVITTGHLGLIARPPEQQYRCDITVYKFGPISGPVFERQHKRGFGDYTFYSGPSVRKAEGEGPVILQKYIFHGACPISITGEEYNYSPATGPVIRETTFVYNHYTVSHEVPENFTAQNSL